MYNDISVKLIDSMGSDLTVVNAARVSFSKVSEWEGERHWTGEIRSKKLSERDEKLINYLATHKHWSPFAHCVLQFHIVAPVFVARQLAKHQVGFAWNEVSRRYVNQDPTFWTPSSAWRGKAENKKQGSTEECVERSAQVQAWYDELISHASSVYTAMLESGVCPEQARAVLPQGMMTEWYWTGSLYGFSRVCSLRLDPHAQKECQTVAQMIDEACRKEFPASWRALREVA